MRRKMPAHTPGGDGRLSGVDIGTLRSMRLDCMAAVGVKEDGTATSLYAGYIGEAPWARSGRCSYTAR